VLTMCALLDYTLSHEQVCHLGSSLTDIEMISLLLGAIVHDFKHPGRRYTLNISYTRRSLIAHQQYVNMCTHKALPCIALV
jgi:3'5'-cyclic nucleotide phosphodiesterase